ncbi:hypothetical protein LAZ67_15001650 [Cordylochernes scorpioides]|uniref:Transposase n=1 Tax=Cordylochernes scorpioides TaxID=51811 RepID=A0ABY6L8W9_9ARAC|nr:hypothetical protein LAZ67_15001650 [Cordylochernes scorpioides]
MEAPLKDCTTLEQRAVILFLNAEGIQTSQICQKKKNIYVNEFKNGRITCTDIERPGRPSVTATPSTINEVENLILEDRKISIFTIADNLNISYGTVHTIIKEQLQFIKICCRWIPHFLNLGQKLNRIRVSKALLKRYEEEGDHFLDQIVTGDESWCYHYDPSTKRATMEWKRGDSPRPKKIRSQRSAGKVLLTIFWDVDGPICLDFLSSRQRMNSDLYCDILVNKLKPGIRNKRRGKLSKGVLFLHDNAMPHTSCKTVSTIIKLDLAPSDYFLFGLLKKELKGKRFDSDEDVQKVVQDFFHTLPKSAYKEGFCKLPERWRRCIESQALKCTIAIAAKVEVFWIVFDFYLLKKMDQRTCIKFCVKNEIKCADAFRMLTVAYREATLDRSNVYRWYKMFSEGREDVNNEERAGRPSTSITEEKINEVEKMILANHRITVREVAEDLNISIGSCHLIFIND